MKSILIAEGDERVAELFAYIFARDGWTVATYRDGQRAAVALGDTASFDAALVSNRLRDMGGVELITRNPRARPPQRHADRDGDRLHRRGHRGRRFGRRRG
jgi:DNA-binding response OmpR family regulator